MHSKLCICLFGCWLLSGCANDSANSTDAYATYNCNQLSMEKYALTDDIQQASGQESTHQIYQLAMAAFALSNGENYQAKADSGKVDELSAQLAAVRHEAIRKQCNW